MTGVGQLTQCSASSWQSLTWGLMVVTMMLMMTELSCLQGTCRGKARHLSMLQTQGPAKGLLLQEASLPSGTDCREPVSHHGLSTKEVPSKFVWLPGRSHQRVSRVCEGPRQEVTGSGLSRMIPVPPTWPYLSGSRVITGQPFL